MDKFGLEQEAYYQEDIDKLGCVTKREHMKGNELMDNFRYQKVLSVSLFCSIDRIEFTYV